MYAYIITYRTRAPEEPLDGRSGDHNVAAARLGRWAALGIRLGRLACTARLLRLLSGSCLRRAKAEESVRYQGAQRLQKQLFQAISTQIAGLTLVLLVSVPALNFAKTPSHDLSMQAWATLLAARNTSGVGWRKEVEEFEAFYQLLLYGPYLVCGGGSGALGGPGCAGSETLWTSGRGQMGSALMGSQNMLFLFDRGIFGVLPLSYFYIPKSARAYPFSPICQNALLSQPAPLVFTPFVLNQRRSRRTTF